MKIESQESETYSVLEDAVSDSSRPASSFASDVMKLGGGTALGQALTLLVAPILTRLYAPDAFGTAAIFVSISGIISAVACLRYEQSIILPKEEKEAVNLLGVSLLLVLVVSGTTLLVIRFAKGAIVRALNAPDLTPYLWLLPLAVLINGGFLALNYWNSRTRQYGRLSIARVFASVATNATQLGMGVTRFAHAGSLIGARVLGTAVVTGLLGAQIWRDDGHIFAAKVRWKEMVEGAKRYRKFPLIDVWGTLTNTLSGQLPPLLLSSFFSQTVVGFYSLAFRLIELPMTLIGGSISQVFYQRASDSYSKGEELSKIFAGVFQRLAAIGLLPALLITIVGEDLIVMVFGQNWSEAGKYLQILAPWFLFRFISSPLSTLFIVLERQELILIVHFVILFTRVVTLLIGGLIGDVFVALWLYAGSGVLVYGGLLIWNAMLAGASLRSTMRALFPHGIYSLFALVALLSVKIWFSVGPVFTVVLGLLILFLYCLLVLQRDVVLRRYVYSSLERLPSRSLRESPRQQDYK